MPPRGRPRKGQKRIDAAIDALKQMGFSAPVVRKTVNSLLKEYGGDDGWPFIEEGSYKLVIEQILEKQKELLLKDKEDEEENRGGAGASEVSEQPIHDCDAILLETSVDTPAHHGSRNVLPSTCQNAALTREEVGGPSNVSSDVGASHVQQPAVPSGPRSPDHGSRNVLPSTCQNAALTREEVGGPSNVNSDVGASHVQQPAVPSGPRSPGNIQQLKPRRKPCYGWISESESEDELEGSQFVANAGCRERKRKSGWDVKTLGMY